MNPEFARQPNAMAEELRRWRRWPHARRAVRHFGLTTTARVRRTSERRSVVGMVYRRSVHEVRLVTNRFTLRPLTYAPQVYLSVTRRHSTPLGRAYVRRQRDGEPRPDSNRLRTDASLPTSRERRDPRKALDVARSRRTSRSPVLLNKARQVASSTNGVTGRATESTTERIIQSHNRVETRQHTNAVIREQANIAVEVERAITGLSRREHGQPGTPSLFAAAQSDTGRFITPDGPELDQLTDQIVRRIDDRLTAQRERMGRW